MLETFDSDKRKFLRALCHGSMFFSALLFTIGLPIAVLFVSDDPLVKQSAKEAINLHLNVWVYGAIAAVLWFLWCAVITVPVAVLFSVLAFTCSYILPSWAIFKVLTQPDDPIRYPFIVRLPL